MISPIFDADAFKILTVVSASRGSRFSRNELKKMTRINNVPLDNALLAVVHSSILKKEGKYFFLNLENPYAKQVSDIALAQYRELRELPFAAYFSVLDAVSFLCRFKGINAYLFGSYSKLVFKETSDIDLAIVSDSAGESRKDISRALQKIEKRYGKAIEPHYFSRQFYKNKKDPLVAEILKNGIRLI